MDFRDVIPAADLAVYEKARLGKAQPWGKRPALLVVDVVRSFVGSARSDVLTAIDEFDTACGESAWETLPRMREVLDMARDAGLPVCFTKGSAEQKAHCGDSVKGDDGAVARRRHSTPIVDDLAPLEDEFVLEKAKASAFFGTPLSTWLVRAEADSVIVIGTSTSGCVRATVVDAHSHGFPVFVVGDACFDRSTFFHKVSLFDMNAKYATVVSVAQVSGYLRRLAA